MKILSPIICIVLLVAFGFASITEHQKINFDTEIDHVFKGISKFAKKKYRMKTIGTGISCPEYILKSIGVSFQIDHQFTLEESRKILLDIAAQMRNEVNSSKVLISHMEKSPFSLNNVCVKIFFVHEDGTETYHPDWGVVSFFYGEFHFKTDKPNSFDYELDLVEPYLGPK